MSPASASIAKSAVPPRLSDAEARLKVPGHMIPTEKPHIPHPINCITGLGTSDMQR